MRKERGLRFAARRVTTERLGGSANSLTKIYVELDGRRIVGRNSVPDSGSRRQNNFFEILGDKEERIFEYVPIPNIGSPKDYADVDVSGKIALVKRGKITFEEKVKNAAEKGAIGVIIYNNVEGRIEQYYNQIFLFEQSAFAD